jgi:hypothetical protein
LFGAHSPAGRYEHLADLDFSALLALGGYDQPSLITLRLAMSDPETVTRRLLGVLPGLSGSEQR